MFAKLFETDIGQIVVLMDRHDITGDPVIQIFCEPEGLGTCHITLSYPDHAAGWDKRAEVFARLDEAAARKVLQPLLKMAPDVAKSVEPDPKHGSE